MTIKNNGRTAGQKNQRIRSARSVKKRMIGNASYTLVTITGKTTMPKEKPLMQKEKLLKAVAFVKALNPLLYITYRFTCEKMSFHKCAMRHVLNWISGNPPNMVINYSKILVASGNRFNTDRAAAKPVGDTILFKWENDLIPKDYATDKAVLVAYCEALNKCIFTTMGPPRTARKAQLPVAEFRGRAVHTWLSFITADGKQVADSIYTGKLIIGKYRLRSTAKQKDL
ncbi:DUF6266 family protein [Niastella sp. OAS944]|uniref:DUF6266 family protein n=1 Tax=Niastella sp. OAS944 TaxID=2664089 RepID=UPI0034910DCB|nr:hypothetical protein [Chitinophagaceae bacterium OAS944]